MATVTTRPNERWLLGRYDYPLIHRVIEVVVVIVFVAFATPFAWQVGLGLAERWQWWRLLWLVVVAIAAYALADLVSGVVHFAFDNLGSPDTPVIGQKFVRPFRDHHDDPRAMTHGDLIAVNGDNVLASLFLLVPTSFLLDVRRHPLGGAFVLTFIAGVIATNQIHKWCHMPEVPRWVRTAQRVGLILSPAHHDIHHRAPFREHYCITWGHVDVLLDRLTRRARLAGRPERG